jgi:hypothetical protein
MGSWDARPWVDSEVTSHARPGGLGSGLARFELELGLSWPRQCPFEPFSLVSTLAAGQWGLAHVYSGTCRSGNLCIREHGRYLAQFL